MTSMAEEFNGVKDRTTDNVKRAASEGRRELGSFFDDVEELLARVTNLKDEDIARMRGKVEESLRGARETAGRTAQRVRDSVSDAASSTDDYVRERPWTMVGVAALVGLALGVALSRR